MQAGIGIVILVETGPSPISIIINITVFYRVVMNVIKMML
jgi:hypothetical protein